MGVIIHAVTSPVSDRSVWLKFSREVAIGTIWTIIQCLFVLQWQIVNQANDLMVDDLNIYTLIIGGNRLRAISY